MMTAVMKAPSTSPVTIKWIIVCLFLFFETSLWADDIYASQHLFRGIEIQANLTDPSHSYDVYRSESNVFGEASLLTEDILSGVIYADNQARADRSYYYWAINTLDTEPPIGSVEGKRSLTNIDFSSWKETTQATYAEGETWVADDLGIPVYGGGAWLIPVLAQEYYLRSVDDGLTWSKVVTPFYRTAAYRDTFTTLAFGNNVWVARGSRQELYYSDDGLTWTSAIVGGIKHLIFGGGKFMVTKYFPNYQGGSRSFTSTDGITWTEGGSILETLQDYDDGFLIYGNGVYLFSATSNGWFRRSTDGGVTWTTVNSMSSSGTCHLIFANGQFIRVIAQTTTGTNNYEHDYHYYTSTDGQNWSYTKYNWLSLGFKLIESRQIVSANNLFWAYGNGELYKSSDGISWTQTSRDNRMKVAYGNGNYIATGVNGYISRSTDGNTWTGVNALTNRRFSDVAVLGQKAVAVGWYGLVASSSDGGKTWSLIENLFPTPSGVLVQDYHLLNVVVRNGGFFILGYRNSRLHAQGPTIILNGEPFTGDPEAQDVMKLESTDGVNWSSTIVYQTNGITPERMQIAGNTLYAANDQLFLAGTYDLWHSATGSSWAKSSTSIPNGLNNSVRGATYFNGTYYWYGYVNTFGSYNYVYTSANPVADDWVLDAAIPVTPGIIDMEVIDGQLIARGGDTWATSDGSTWGQIDYVTGQKIAKHNDVQVGNSAQYFYTSTDGLHYATDQAPVSAVWDFSDSEVVLGVSGHLIYRAALPVVELPAIQNPPASVSVPLAEDLVITIQATGDPILEYQWYLGESGDVTAAIGTDSASVTLLAVTEDTQVWVRVGNPYGSVDSPTIPVTVILPIPELTSSDTLIASAGKPVYFKIEATHEPDFFSATGLPAGLSIDEASGVISGISTQVGTFPVDLIIKNGIYEGSAEVSLTLNPPAPAIVSSPQMSTQVGVSFQYQITASGTPSSYSSTALPTGLSLDTSTGLLSGIPTESGHFIIELSAINGSGTGILTLVLDVSADPNRPQINSPLFAVTRVQESFSYLITHLNSADHFTAQNVPAGLIFNAQTGQISGNASVTGTHVIEIGVWDVNDQGDSQSLNLYVGPPENTPRSTSVVEAQLRTGDSIDITFAATESPTHFTLSQTSGSPSGFWSFDGATGKLMGTAPQAGTYQFNLTPHNTNGAGESVTWTLKVLTSLTAPVVSNPGVFEGTQNQSFSVQLTATQSGDSFELDGALPSGISLSNGGLLSGTPLIFGVFDFKVSSSFGGVVGAYQDLQISIVPDAALAEVDGITPQDLEVGQIFVLKLESAQEVTGFQVSGLPNGLDYDVETQQIFGSPTQLGEFVVSISAVNASGVGQALQVPFKVRSPFNRPQVISAASARGTVGDAFSYSIIYQLESGDTFLGYQVARLPRGLAYDAASQRIVGTPIVSGSFAVTITAISSFGSSDPLPLEIRITRAPQLPSVSNVASIYGETGVELTFQITSSISPVLAYAVENLPQGLVLDRFTGEIHGKPTVAGRHLSHISVATSAGTSAPLEVCFHIKAGILAPQISRSVYINGTLGEETVAQIIATGLPSHGVGNPLPDGFSYHADGLPEGLQLNPQTGMISGVILSEEQTVITVWASNEAGEGAKRSGYVWGYRNSSIYPHIIGPAQVTMNRNETFNLQINARNATYYYLYAGGLLEHTYSGNTTGAFSIKALKTGVGGLQMHAYKRRAVPIRYRRYTYYWYRDTKYVRVDILPDANSPRMITPSRVSTVAGEPFELPFSASPAATSYDLRWDTRLPAGLVFDWVGNRIHGTATEPGRYPIVIRAYNNNGFGLYRETEITVYAADDAPVLTGLEAVVASEPAEAMAFSPSAFLASTYLPSPDAMPEVIEVVAGEATNWQLSATGSVTRFEVDGLPDGLLLNPSSGHISGIADQPGDYPLTIRPVHEEQSGKSIISILRVLAVAGAPMVQMDDEFQAQEGILFQLQIGADNAPNGYTVTGLPSGITFNSATGLISGTPVEMGDFELLIMASNATGDSYPASATLHVSAAVGTPEITSATEHTLQVDALWQHTVTTSLAATYFTATELPTGLSMDTATGEFTGTPLEPGIYNVEIRAVNDVGIGNVALHQLTVNGLAGTSSVQTPTQTIFNTKLTQTLQLSSSGATSFNLNDLPEGFRINAQTGALDFSRAPRGLYTFIASANNGTGEGNPLAVTLRVGAAYDVWAGQQFGTPIVLDESKRSAQWGWWADPDKDEHRNILEYLLMSDPERSASGPKISLEISAESKPQLNITSRIDAEWDIMVESSTDLDFGSADVLSGTVQSSDASTRDLQFEHPTPLDSSPTRFMRLRIQAK